MGVRGQATSGGGTYTSRWGGFFEGSNGAGNNTGVYGAAHSSSSTAVHRGVSGYASGGTNSTIYGVYGDVSSTVSSAQKYAGYFNGKVYATEGYYPSDKKLKKNIKVNQNAMNKLLKIKSVEYEFKADEYASMNLPRGLRYGLLADDLAEAFPEVVVENKHVPMNAAGEQDGEATMFKCVNYVGLIPVLVSVLQEQQKQIEELKAALGTKSK